MKYLFPTLIAVCTFFACGKKKEFDSLKKGIKSSEVLSLVGEPEQKMPMMSIEWWMYPKDNKLVVIGSDTVINVVQDLKASQDSMKVFSDQFKSMTDSLQESMK